MKAAIFSDEYFMQRALQLASQAMEEEEIPIGAVIVTQEGRIIGQGYNQTERLNDVTAHAEILALSAACQHLGSKYLKDCRLYVTIEPCPMCAAALHWAQVPDIIYGARDPKRGYSTFSPSLLHPKTTVRDGVMGTECAALMKQFFKARR